MKVAKSLRTTLPTCRAWGARSTRVRRARKAVVETDGLFFVLRGRGAAD